MRNIPSKGDKVIDSRDIIARIDDLISERESFNEEHEQTEVTSTWMDECSDDNEELRVLLALAEEGEGSPDWQHGETLIRDSYFETYAQELAEDCGMMTGSDKWPYTCIDWEKAADELKQDYSSIDFDGETYWIRS